MSVEALKLELIDTIMGLEDPKKLIQLKAKLIEMWSDNELLIQKLSKPMRKEINIEELKKEQNFKPIDKAQFFKKMDALEIEESLEDLIRMI